MNWLNKIDELLDRFLPPQTPTNENGETDDDSNNKYEQSVVTKDESNSKQKEELVDALHEPTDETRARKDILDQGRPRLSDSPRKLPGIIVKAKRTPRLPRPQETEQVTEDGTLNNHVHIDRPSLSIDYTLVEESLINNLHPKEQVQYTDHDLEIANSSEHGPLISPLVVGQDKGTRAIEEIPTLLLETSVSNRSGIVVEEEREKLHAHGSASSQIKVQQQEDNMNITDTSSFTINPATTSQQNLQLDKDLNRNELDLSSFTIDQTTSSLVDTSEVQDKRVSLLDPSPNMGPPISSLDIVKEEDQKDAQSLTTEEYSIQQSSSNTIQYPYSSSETVEDSNGGSSITLDFVRSQALSLRAAMGDFDYGYDPSKDDEDSSSNITEYEGEDYNYGDHILPWNVDSDQLMNGSLVQPTHDSIPLNPLLHKEFQPSMNCHGVFHIRLLRAQHVPCGPKTTIQTVISLPPWKGKIRSPSGQTYKGPSKAGTCFRWQDLNVDPHAPVHEPCFSMIHTYNNEETPVPSIVIQVKDISYPMFEKELFSITLSCKILMKSPFTWRRRWCVADSSKAGDELKRTSDIDVERNETLDPDKPMILLEAIFEPTNFLDMQSKTQQTVMDDESCTGTIESSCEDVWTQECESPTRKNAAFSETSSVSSSTVPMNLVRKGLSTPHLFHIMSTWRPGYCGVCSATMGLWNRYYQCETCGLDCCNDCQLRVDLELPCGSEAANIKVNQAKDSKITLRRVMAVLAPINEEDPIKNRGVIETSFKEAHNPTIGTLKLKVHRALIFQKSFPTQVEIVDLYKMKDRWSRSGDYYIRISWSDGSGDSKRTKTVFQTSNPIFESEDMLIPVMTYGTEYLIEAIDATTDKAIGATLLSTQGILQWQRDQSVLNEGVRLKSFPTYSTNNSAIRRTLELRVPWKNSFGLDFYKTGNINDVSQAGEVTGLLDLDVSLHEKPTLFSFANPVACPERSVSDFHIDLIQIHIARIKALVDDVYALLDAYYFLVSWDNRALTSLSLLIFVTTCLTLKAEYIGSVPLFILLITMIHLRRIRVKGDFMMRWIKKEVKTRKGQSNIAESKASIFRPMAILEVGISQGQNLISQHGLPGSAVVQVLFDPTVFLDDKTKKSVRDIDASTKCIHHLGTTESCGVTSVPRWKNLLLSEECERLQQFLPGYNILGDEKTIENNKVVELCGIEMDEGPKMSFPILQPIIESPMKQYDRDGNVIESTTFELVPWESSPAGIIFRVRFSDVLNRSLFEEKLGDVIIPLKQLARQREIQGWFEVINSNSKSLVPPSDHQSHENEIANNTFDVVGTNLTRNGAPVLFLTAKLTMSVQKSPSEVEKETSIAIDEEYIRSSYQILNPRLGIIESSINTLTSVRGVGENIQYLQNQLGYVLDLFEMTRNLFNFSCPEKSMLLLALLFAAWLILILIPTRLVILCLGLGQYASTFMSAFYKAEALTTQPSDPDNNSPLLTWLLNFLYSTPTDEDLRRCYFWETRRHAEQELAKIFSVRRSARLTKLWKARWFGTLEMRTVGNHGLEWESVFSVIIGHRFIWWRSEKHFDQGESPMGKIMFSGHSGLAGLSPLELRLLKNIDLSHIVSIFGRGDTDQIKITLMVSDQETRENFEKAVLQACVDSKVD